MRDGERERGAPARPRVWRLAMLRELMPRRYLLRRVALELFLEGGGAHFLTFADRETRRRVHHAPRTPTTLPLAPTATLEPKSNPSPSPSPSPSPNPITLTLTVAPTLALTLTLTLTRRVHCAILACKPSGLDPASARANFGRYLLETRHQVRLGLGLGLGLGLRLRLRLRA